MTRRCEAEIEEFCWFPDYGGGERRGAARPRGLGPK